MCKVIRIEALEEALEEDGTEIDVEVRYLLSITYASQNNPQKVLEHASALAEKIQDNSFSRTSLYLKGWALKQLGRQEEAEKVFKDASSLYRLITIQEPGNVDLHLLRALCLKEIKKHEEAIEVLKYTMIMAPDMPEIKNALEEVYKEIGGKNERPDIQ